MPKEIERVNEATELVHTRVPVVSIRCQQLVEGIPPVKGVRRKLVTA